MKNGALEPHEMRQLLLQGKSIVHGGEHITHHSQLPSLGELTKGNPEARQAERERLEAEMDRLFEQRRELLDQEDASGVEDTDDPNKPEIGVSDPGIQAENLEPAENIEPSPFGQKPVKDESIPFTGDPEQKKVEAKKTEPKKEEVKSETSELP